MIFAAGLSPAWQQILVFDKLEVGEVNRAKQSCWAASGKCLNVAVALHHLGSPCLCLSLAGGMPGAQLRQEFQELGVPARWVEMAAPSRVCTTILDRSRHCTTELVENAPPITPAEQQAFLDIYRSEVDRADIVVLSGSLSGGVPVNFYRTLMEHTKGTVILDARGSEMLAALEYRPFLVKPNKEELGRTVGRELRSEEELVQAMRELNRLGADWVVITAGAGPLHVSSKKAVYQVQPPKREVSNPIGSGDCLAAGIAWGISRGWDPVEAVRFGVAAAADNVSQLMPARLNLDRVMEILPQIRVRSWE